MSALKEGLIEKQLKKEGSKIQANLGFKTKDEKRQREEQEEADEKWYKIAHYSVVGISLVSSILSMVAFPGSFIYLTMLFPLVMGPYTVVQRKRASKLGTFRSQNQAIRDEVNELNMHNSALTDNTNRLNDEVSSLKDVEDTLQDITSKQGTDVKRLVDLVNENEKIQNKINLVLERKATQNIIEVILNADRDYDFYLNNTEVELLVLRLHNIGGMEFDENKFRDFVINHSEGFGKNRRIALDVVLELATSVLAESRNGLATAHSKDGIITITDLSQIEMD
mmetsp:Transcript_16841/g.24650  ORF Transcript_16841/g.24650 Transcript_16841/m.24650 type:complete len:281 (+) Transcript_16841:77-919(+)|eukprot:CAMPEP_0195515208 /NCGR_PEP_ID=MMETSP0794_2-20130614/6362_1 /TAXON_ID=515487 /ORGANISM="Stephanopyxis turris, Strain CCMP 815" /LENGTH=280 /DNA_ID=CAMNT_0040643603 /DNA_START=68 /DNA_END=910 /DNA_ORIENTATION=+